jgi:hypothetical protein
LALQEDILMLDFTGQNPLSEHSNSSPAPAATSVLNEKTERSNLDAPRVAVIGVHGVAHHDPGATANAMADLLLSLPATNHDQPRYYDGFHAVGIQVPLQRLSVSPMVQGPTGFAEKFSLQETSAEFAYLGAQYARKNLAAGKNVPRGAAGLAYMRRLLQGYEGGADGDVYVTTRLEGNRTAETPEGPAEVHIYEVLWADLARPTSTLLSFLSSLFQLLFHFGSLSRLAIDSGAAENPDFKWKVFRRVQRYAVRMLQLPIPLLKIVLLIALFSCLPALSGNTHDRIWFPLVMGGVAGLAITYLVNRNSTGRLHTSPTLWAFRAIFPMALGVGTAGALLASHRITPDELSAFECWLILGLALLFYVLDKYKNVRRGAQPVGWFLFSLCFLTFSGYLVFLHTSNFRSDPKVVLRATLWTAQWTVAALRLSWMFLFVFVWLALVLGSIAWRSIPKAQREKRARARAAVRTTRFALALPSLMFLLVTTILWAGMFSIARGVHDPIFEEDVLTVAPGGGQWLVEHNLVPDPQLTVRNTDRICDPSKNPSCAKINLARIKELDEKAYDEPFPGKDSDGRLTQVVPVPDTKWKNARPDYLEDILIWSAGSGLAATLALLALALFLLFWWALPSAFSEKFRLRDEKKPPRFTTNAGSLRMGTWLSPGLDATSVVTFLSWCAIFLVPPLFLPGVEPWTHSQMLNDLANRISGYLGTGNEITRWIVKSFAVGATAAALAVAVKYGSPVLGAILDVDTYLRTLPEDATPRAKIAERYVSLLRYIARYRGPDGRGYDSVVIVAHSLGSVISADLLLYLKEFGDPELAALGLAGKKVPDQGGISMKMLTMGNPTRQLLNRFFPYLYDWVRDEPDNGLCPLPDPAPQSPSIDENAFPNPHELGLETWMNVYRSGDYVGRSLWLDEWYCRTNGPLANGAYPQPIYVATAGSRGEACIGAGAHTRYWDDTAPDVAEFLDKLIKS